MKEYEYPVIQQCIVKWFVQARDVCGELTDADIIAEVTNEEQKNWDEEEDSNSVNIQPVPKSTRNRADYSAQIFGMYSGS